MKTTKYIIITCLLFLCCTPMNVFAVDNEGSYYYLTPEEIRIAEQKDLEEAKAKSIQPHMNGIVENLELSGSTTTGWGPFKPCLKQDAQGHVFSSKGSGFYWSDSATTSSEWNVGVSIGGKAVSISIGYQPGNNAGSSGVFEKCPDELIGKKVKLFCRRQYKINRYSVYQKNKYDPGKGKFVRYIYTHTRISRNTKVDVYTAHK